MSNWVANPGGRPLVIAADSAGEGVAFFACALREDANTETADFSRTLVVSGPEALGRVAEATRDAIIVVADARTETAAASLVAKQRIAIVRPRSSLESDRKSVV